MPFIEIARDASAGDEPMRLQVVVHDDGDTSSTAHEVTVSAGDLERLGSGRSPEEFVSACFEFLLDREPKESILRTFDLSVVSQYFPDYDHEIRSRLAP